MLTKLVNGESIVMSDSEEKNIRAYWAFNDEYPEYSGNCGWDGVNEPSHDMEGCKKSHAFYINQCVALAVRDINDSIEKAQEAGEDPSPFYKQRGSIKALATQDISKCQSVADLRASIPAELKPYWSMATKQ